MSHGPGSVASAVARLNAAGRPPPGLSLHGGLQEDTPAPRRPPPVWLTHSCHHAAIPEMAGCPLHLAAPFDCGFPSHQRGSGRMSSSDNPAEPPRSVRFGPDDFAVLRLRTPVRRA